MNSIVFATAAVTGIGLLCAVMLAAASKIMHVPGDDGTDRLREVLPGVNCGACGYSGCDGYARALASGAATNLCVPGGAAVSRQISEILGVTFSDVQGQVAAVRCGGTLDKTGRKMDYAGIETCHAAKQLFGGEGACRYACLGYGDCAAVCPEDAICIEAGIARVDVRRCVGCGLCEKACPKDLILMLPDTVKMIVRCASRDRGAETRRVCSAGCICCKRCEEVCPTGAVKVTDNLAAIDYDRCIGCGQCAKVCPTGCIQIADMAGIRGGAAGSGPGGEG